MFLCHTVLIQVLIVLLLHQIVMLWLPLVFVMRMSVFLLMKTGTWSLCDLPFGKKAIGTKWVYKPKRKLVGTVDRYKARLVVKGYAQEKGIDFDKTFAPTCNCSSSWLECTLVGH